jgi:hypothetical protein
MKKRIDIVALLRWTYRDELPKMPYLGGDWGDVAPMWRSIDRYGELLTLIDDQRNRFGLVPDFGASTLPHPDAYAVYDAVQELDCYEFAIPEGWDPLDDMSGLGTHGVAAVTRALDIITVTDAAGVRRLRKPMSMLIMQRAIMGGVPEWEGDQPEVKPVRENGAIKWFRRVYIPLDHEGFGGYEVEVDGFNTRKRVPYPDAYKKYYLDPDPQETIIGRAEYELWLSALGQLVTMLADRLDIWTVTGENMPKRPWLERLPDKAILPDLRR